MNSLLSENIYDIAIVGAGAAGSYCAHRLQAVGLDVCVIDKSRGTGGRASSKRLASDGVPANLDAQQSCELGAPFFHLEDQQLAESVNSWLAAGVIAPWPAADKKSQIAFTGTPTMSSLTRHLVQRCDFFGSEKISIIEQDVSGWRLLNDSYQCRIRAKRLIITAPAAQSAVLLSSSAAPETWLIDAHRASRTCSPQWATAVSVNHNLISCLSQVQIEVLERLPAVIESEVGSIARIVCDSRKPQRTASEYRWVLQADEDWSQQQIDADNQWVSQQLLETFVCWLNDQQGYSFAVTDFSCLPAHRWRLGRHHGFLSAQDNSLDNLSVPSADKLDYRYCDQLGLAIAADWLGEGSVYSAMKSADNLVSAMLASE